MHKTGWLRALTLGSVLSWTLSGWASHDFYMVFTADPQLTWACAEGSLCQRLAGTVDEQGFLSNIWQSDSINKLVQQYGAEFKGVVVNGDLTAFGHSDEFKQYKKYFRDRIVAPLYEGLGNHDYSNNVDDCMENNCAHRMVTYMHEQILAMGDRIANYDFDVSKTYYHWPFLRKDYSGSLAYSFNIGKVHIVQLHNHPAYRREFTAWDFKHARKAHFHIKPSFDWLERDLKEARQQGMTIVVNMHDFKQHMNRQERERMKSLLVRYRVSAAFWGHYHANVGRTERDYPIPVFSCGSSPYNSYLLVHFHDNRLAEVQVIRSDYGAVTIQDHYLL